jgi:hypothetical protein
MMIMIRSFHGRVALSVILGTAICLGSCAQSANAAEPSATDVDRWIGELGSDNYSVRKAAAQELSDGGFASRAALSRAADGPDPEIRAAARRLVALIDDSEFHRRLAEFAADTDGSRGVTLPGWNEFAELVGRDPAARALFVDMQREEASLLGRMFADSKSDQEVAWEAQVGRLMRARIYNQPSEFTAPLGSCATLLFLGSLSDANISDNGARSLVQLTQIPPVSNSLAAKEPRSAVRRLVSAWIVHCPNRSETVVEQRLAIMLQQNLAEALPFALEIIGRDPKYLTISPSRQVMAILAVGKFGSEEHVTAIEPLLEDRTELVSHQQLNGPGTDLVSIQVRDVALAVLLHLTGQEPLTYGFLHARSQEQTVFDISSLSMKDDQQRAEAAERWHTWRAQHKLEATRPASS